MRCMNCGWDNLPNASVCLKCGQPLKSTEPYGANNFMPGDEYRENAVSKPTVLNVSPQEQQCRKTVILTADNEAVPQTQAEVCPNCHYPVIEGFASCPNCGTPITKKKEEPEKEAERTPLPESEEKAVLCQQCKKEVDAAYSFCPHCGTRIHRATIVRQIKNIVVNDEPNSIPHCSLTLMPEENETVAAEKTTYEGKSVILNRENTEKSNRTITSKKQAEISFEEGHWYLTDLSELHTTYIQLNRKREIKPDDIIVLGDRRFKFECEQ